MNKMSRRTWNNVLIIGIVCFIGLMFLPEYFRAKLADAEREKAQPGVISLLPDAVRVKALQFNGFRLYDDGKWQSDRPLSVSADELANRWITLSGTVINEGMLKQMKPGLTNPETLNVIIGEQQQAYRLTFYRLDKFWLLQNWENRWLAVSVDQNYLLPDITAQ